MHTPQGASIERAFDQGFKIAAKRYLVVFLNYIILYIITVPILVGITWLLVWTTQIGIIFAVIALILFPAFYGGFYGSLVRIGRGEPGQIGDFLKIGFNKFGPLLGATILYLLGVIVGLMLFLIPGIYLIIAWFFVPFLIVDKNLPITKAFSESMRLIHKKVGWWKTFGLIFFLLLISFGIGIISVIPFIGFVIYILVPIFLAPFLYMVCAIYYIDSVRN